MSLGVLDLSLLLEVTFPVLSNRMKKDLMGKKNETKEIETRGMMSGMRLRCIFT